MNQRAAVGAVLTVDAARPLTVFDALIEGEVQLPLRVRVEDGEASLPCPGCTTRAPDALEIRCRPGAAAARSLIPTAIDYTVRGGVAREPFRLAGGDSTLLLDAVDRHGLHRVYVECGECGLRASLDDVPVALNVLAEEVEVAPSNAV